MLRDQTLFPLPAVHRRPIEPEIEINQSYDSLLFDQIDTLSQFSNDSIFHDKKNQTWSVLLKPEIPKDDIKNLCKEFMMLNGLALVKETAVSLEMSSEQKGIWKTECKFFIGLTEDNERILKISYSSKLDYFNNHFFEALEKTLKQTNYIKET